MYVTRNCLELEIKIQNQKKTEKELNKLIAEAKNEPVIRTAIIDVLMSTGLIPSELICYNPIEIIDTRAENNTLIIRTNFNKRKLAPVERFMKLINSSSYFNLVLDLDVCGFLDDLYYSIKCIEEHCETYVETVRLQEPIIMVFK